jgi:hypothetical protein
MKSFSQALAELSFERQSEIESLLLRMVNDHKNGDHLYKELIREGKILETKRFTYNGDYYRQDDILHDGIVYVVEMRNGSLKRITK